MEYGAVIDSYTDKVIAGYALDYVTGMPLTVGSDESANIIRVYYGSLWDAISM